ncbi:MAG: TIR domain-containing protein, partial [Deltaproteobacteria bacterium]
MKTFFISHSSRNNPLVIAVAEILGQEQCWLDAWELRGGEDILKVIDAGVEAVKVFVIFWSADAKASPWVDEELGQARYRRLRRGDVTIVAVKLDNTPMPTWLERLLYIDGKKGPEHIARELARVRDESSLQTPVEEARQEDSFQNRLKESERIERAYHSPEHAGVILSGLPGMGKTALWRWTLRHRLAHLSPLKVDLEVGNTPAFFFGSLAKNLELRLPASVTQSGDWSDYWTKWVLPSIDPDAAVLIIDGTHLALDPAGRLPEWLENVFRDLLASSSENQLRLILATNKPIPLPARVQSKVEEIQLGRLPDEDVIRSLRYRLSITQPRRTASEPQLEEAAGFISGYPLGAQLWAAYAVKVGVDLAILDPAPVQKQVQDLVADMLSKAAPTEAEQRVLLLLSVLRLPASVESLVRDLDVKAETLTSLERSFLLDPTADGIAVHGLLGKHIVEKYSSHVAVTAAHERVGRYYLKEWRAAPEEFASSAVLGSQAYFHLLAAGRMDDAAAISWSLTEEARNAMIELYRTHQDEIVISIGKQLIRDLGKKADPSILFYYGLACGRRNDGADDRREALATFDRLLKLHVDNRFYWSGYGDTLSRLGKDQEAKKAYTRARALSDPRDPVPSNRLGELLLREGKIEEAETFLHEAHSRAPGDLRVVASYAALLQQQGKLEDALRLVKAGLQRR